MSNTECRYLCNPDILAVTDCTKYTVKVYFTKTMGDVVRAGTPISREGYVKNNAAAFGILLRDTWRDSPYANICIDGFINLPLAQEHSGVVLTPEAKSAMKNITFVADYKGVGAQSNWDQEYPEAADYIKGRTHYMYSEVITEAYDASSLKGYGALGSDRKRYFPEGTYLEIHDYEGRRYFVDPAQAGSSISAVEPYTGWTYQVSTRLDTSTGVYEVRPLVSTKGPFAYIAYKQHKAKPLDPKFLPADYLTELINSILKEHGLLEEEPEFSLKYNGDEVRELIMNSSGDTFEVTASANTLDSSTVSYQWRILVPSANMWVDIQGKTSPTITLNFGMVSSRAASDGYVHIQCVATDGTTTVTSEDLKIKINFTYDS